MTVNKTVKLRLYGIKYAQHVLERLFTFNFFVCFHLAEMRHRFNCHQYARVAHRPGTSFLINSVQE